MILSNVDVGDVTFDSEVGSWNVTRALAACTAGKHKMYTFDVAEVIAATAAVECEEDKIASMVADRDRLAKSPPPIFVVEDGRVWLIDGHHRVRALDRLGEKQFLAYVIEEADGARYRIFFNGERVAPWRRMP
jgi:hypothetical protein